MNIKEIIDGANTVADISDEFNVSIDPHSMEIKNFEWSNSGMSPDCEFDVDSAEDNADIDLGCYSNWLVIQKEELEGVVIERAVLRGVVLAALKDLTILTVSDDKNIIHANLNHIASTISNHLEGLGVVQS